MEAWRSRGGSRGQGGRETRVQNGPDGRQPGVCARVACGSCRRCQARAAAHAAISVAAERQAGSPDVLGDGAHHACIRSDVKKLQGQHALPAMGARRGGRVAHGGQGCIREPVPLGGVQQDARKQAACRVCCRTASARPAGVVPGWRALTKVIVDEAAAALGIHCNVAWVRVCKAGCEVARQAIERLSRDRGLPVAGRCCQPTPAALLGCSPCCWALRIQPCRWCRPLGCAGSPAARCASPHRWRPQNPPSRNQASAQFLG